MSNWIFSVRQDGLTVASGSAPTEEACRREAGHYATMYGQDGPVAVRVGPAPHKAVTKAKAGR